MISICRIRCAVNLYYGARSITLFRTRLLSSKSPTFESVLSREGLYKNVQLPEASTAAPHKSKLTPLVDELHKQIKFRGPLTMAEYMRQALCHPHHGYYMTRQAFGRQGDFTTSPEISQVFGELIGVWCVSVWEKMGSPSSISLIELGPGKGTLMADILRISRRFPDFHRALSVSLVEASILNIRQQQDALGFAPSLVVPTTDAFYTSNNRLSAKGEDEIPFVYADMQLFAAYGNLATVSHVESKVASESVTTAATSAAVAALQATSSQFAIKQTRATGSKVVRKPDAEKVFLSGRCARYGGVPIQWYPHLANVPPGPTLLIAQEFFDALPIHQFIETSDRGWVERLVDIEIDASAKHHLRSILSPGATPGTSAFVKKLPRSTSASVESTRLHLPAHIKRSPAVSAPLTPETGPTTIVSQIEVCPDGMALVEDIATRLAVSGGAALIIDYGADHPHGNTLQGVQQHQYADIFSEPGQVDLSAHVDFSALRRQASAIKVKHSASSQATSTTTSLAPLGNHIISHGPITQADFLFGMGLVTRVEMLVRHMHETALARFNVSAKATDGDAKSVSVSPASVATDDKATKLVPGDEPAPPNYVTPELIAQQVALVEAVERLVDPEQMGTLFKVMALSHPLLQSLPSFELKPEQHIDIAVVSNSIIKPQSL